ncbi:lipocalin family protein [Idiomarina seosinensis]|uniref:lipocalin family protein n=1 Tax=Idiomarina seosinensis TaxID=281739 RepID=UPI00384AD7A3
MKQCLFSLISVVFLAACQSEPTPVKAPVQVFDAEQYLGKWYEVLRMPHGFEENLIAVSAEYRLNGDGSLEVTNRGWHVNDNEWQTAIGRAEPVENLTAAYQVTFFWPFYGGYYVSWLDPDYQLAMVTSDSHDYFWLLSRTPAVAQSDIDFALAKAKQWGFDIDQMIQVEHPAELR